MIDLTEEQQRELDATQPARARSRLAFPDRLRGSRNNRRS
jgi:hypothetical protein